MPNSCFNGTVIMLRGQGCVRETTEYIGKFVFGCCGLDISE